MTEFSDNVHRLIQKRIENGDYADKPYMEWWLGMSVELRIMEYGYSAALASDEKIEQIWNKEVNNISPPPSIKKVDNNCVYCHKVAYENLVYNGLGEKFHKECWDEFQNDD